MATSKEKRRKRIRLRVRKKVQGTAARPRLSVFRSNKEIYAQLIDDTNAVTLAAAASSKLAASGSNKIETAKLVGKDIAEKAKSLGLNSVVFDRGCYIYHGRVKSLAEGAREGGLQF